MIRSEPEVAAIKELRSLPDTRRIECLKKYCSFQRSKMVYQGIATDNFLKFVWLLLWRILLITTAAVKADASGVLKKGSSDLTAMVVGSVIAVILFVVILLFCCKFCAKKRLKTVYVQDPEMGNYSIDILLQVTANFSEDNILGKGGYGVVYKGELHDGTRIAVKRMEVGLITMKKLKAFQNEIDVLTNVRHRHLVELLGNCVHGNERLLVYEYMPQGTLSQHLFECPERKTTPLCWKQRASIALDVARGVEYLHGLAQDIFIHRDLKPSNILLDDAMRAKVSDFGLVKKAPNRDGNFSFDSKLTGTVGYLSPEYAATGIATTKVDVYAFGVVLMELISGRKALDVTMPDDSIQLVEWFNRRVRISRENILKAIDKTLDIDDEETVESIFKVAELAGHCTEREPDQRPDMGYVVNVLGPLVEKWASRSSLTS